jgi:hypothetical protein
MVASCDHLAHRSVEGVLIYLNAFLALDFARHVFKDNPTVAIIVILILTLFAFHYMRRNCSECAKGPERETLCPYTTKRQ